MRGVEKRKEFLICGLEGNLGVGIRGFDWLLVETWWLLSGAHQERHLSPSLKIGIYHFAENSWLGAKKVFGQNAALKEALVCNCQKVIRAVLQKVTSHSPLYIISFSASDFPAKENYLQRQKIWLILCTDWRLQKTSYLSISGNILLPR